MPAGVARSPTDGPQRRLPGPHGAGGSSVDERRERSGRRLRRGQQIRVSGPRADDLGSQSLVSACVRPDCCPTGNTGLITVHERTWGRPRGPTQVASASVCCPTGNGEGRGADGPLIQGSGARGHRQQASPPEGPRRAGALSPDGPVPIRPRRASAGTLQSAPSTEAATSTSESRISSAVQSQPIVRRIRPLTRRP